MSRDVKESDKSIEEKYIELESEMRKGKEAFESLKLRFKELESEKSVVEEELRNLKESGEDALIEQMMVNKSLEFEKQVAENEAQAWKSKFEKLLETVQKLGVFRDGEFELGEDVKLGLELALGKKTESCNAPQEALGREGLVYHQRSGSPDIATPVNDCVLERRRGNMSSRRRVKKRLSFEDDGSKPAGVVDLCDKKTEERSEKKSDSRETLEEGSEKESDASDTLEDMSIGENYEDEDVEVSEVNAKTSGTLLGRKRKLVITSDSENDDEEDNTPIAILKKLKRPTQEMSDVADKPSTRQRRVSARLRKQKVIEESSTPSERNPKERLVGIPTTGKVEDNETEEESERESESESESLDGFIVDDDSRETVSEKSDDTSSTGQRRVSARLRKQKVSEESSTSSEQISKERLVGIPTTGKVEDDETEEESERESESENLDEFIVDDDSDETGSEKSDETGVEEPDVKINYPEIMSRLRRDKNPEKKGKWVCEGDMLSDFGKDPELCMKAVCALYWFQTEGEKASRTTHIANGRGFSMCDALRGSRIGHFLTDGDPEGNLKKSVEELKNYEYEAVETCRVLAYRYSKQLFEIYKNREVPFFAAPPSP